MTSVNSRDNGLRKKKKTGSKNKELEVFQGNVDKRFNGLERKLDRVLTFLSSSTSFTGRTMMMSPSGGDTASLSGQSSNTRMPTRRPNTNKTLKPYTRRIFQQMPFAQSQQIYQWLQDNAASVNLPMFTSDKELADKLKR